ncbi:MAG: FadR family transcriptional regulator [Oscillospiraceae bacterium]|nr:FadR family transcriptional regulator [Oscillospiraceae bacterium]
MDQKVNTQESLGFKPVSTQRVSQEIVRQIQDAIISGKLNPGDKLPSERDLIAMFGRSRPSVREAFRVLEEAGLINIVGGVGAIVCEPNLKQLVEPLGVILQMKKVTAQELVEVRIITELSIVEWAAVRRTDDDLLSIEKILKKEEELVDNWDAFYQVDRDFHEAIAAAAKNGVSQVLMEVLRESLLAEVIKGFNQLSEEERRKEQSELLDLHHKLYKAIKNCDIQTAKALMITHLEQFEKLVSQK